MPKWYIEERKREVAALREFHNDIVRRASRDPNPYTRALAIGNTKDVNTE